MNWFFNLFTPTPLAMGPTATIVFLLLAAGSGFMVVLLLLSLMVEDKTPPSTAPSKTSPLHPYNAECVCPGCNASWMERNWKRRDPLVPPDGRSVLEVKQFIDSVNDADPEA